MSVKQIKIGTTTHDIHSVYDGNGNNISSTYMTKANPTGTGSLSLNRRANTTVGSNSVAIGNNTAASGNTSYAEGSNTTASGDYSHAEGANIDHNGNAVSHTISATEYPIIGSSDITVNKTTASGYNSHAEGCSTFAFGKYSHAEGLGVKALGELSHAEGGYTTTSGYGSHAEGSGTIASGNNSHAEGANTTASGYQSHAEGYYTTASGYASHAEGSNTKASGVASHASGFGTKALRDYQFVIGKYNNDMQRVGDPEYAFIIGNGTEDADGVITRSNAMTVDWNGDVRANHFILPNGYSIKGTSTTGVDHTIAYISTSDNLMLGTYASNGHPGHTYVNAYNGNLFLRNKTASIRFESYTTSSIDGVFEPATDTKCSIGRADYRWYRLWAASASVQTSDEREKSDIMSLADYPITYSGSGSGNIFEQLYDKLEPKTYTLNIEDNKDVHIGFIAQDIVASMTELGLSEDDLGLIDHSYWTDEETGEEKDRYGLCYEEFAALNTYIIQKLKKRVVEQDEKIAELESKFAELESKFTESK